MCSLSIFLIVCLGPGILLRLLSLSRFSYLNKRLEKTWFSIFLGYQGRKTGLWDVLTVREAEWAYTSQRNTHGETGHLLESPDFVENEVEGHQRGRRPCGAWCHSPPLPSVLPQSYQSHEVLVPSHGSRLRCTQRRRLQKSWGEAWVATSHDAVWENFWDAVRSPSKDLSSAGSSLRTRSLSVTSVCCIQSSQSFCTELMLSKYLLNKWMNEWRKLLTASPRTWNAGIAWIQQARNKAVWRGLISAFSIHRKDNVCWEGKH